MDHATTVTIGRILCYALRCGLKPRNQLAEGCWADVAGGYWSLLTITVAVTEDHRLSMITAMLWLHSHTDSWRTAPRPHNSAPYRPPLAADTSAHPVQAVRTGLPVRSGVRTELAAERHLPGRECGITASSGDLIVPATRRTTMGAGPRLRRRNTARLEQSAGRDPS